MKENDWIVANINNPTFDAGDFQNIADMNLDNTLMLSKDEYLKNDYIRDNDLFKDKSGKFSEDKFNDFYNVAALKFQEFSQNDSIDNYEYDMFDVSRPANGKVKDPNFRLSSEANPNHVEIGISGFNTIEKPTQSARSLAQDSKIYYTAKGEFLDKSVNDISLFSHPIDYFKSLFEDPLVYASYDEDTEEIDPYTGQIVKHKKGEFKINSDGEYYVETLNGRSLLGKLVVSAADYITSEHSALNKYDFLDSDDLDKSVVGSIMKGALAVAPMFIPYLGTVYSGLLISRELSKTAPMLYGMTKSLIGSDDTDSKLANTIAAYGNKFTTSTTDYAQLNTHSIENYANLIADVATQWGQLKAIVSAYSKLAGGSAKAMEAAYSKAAAKYLSKSQEYLYDAIKGNRSLTKTFAEIGTNDLQKGAMKMIEEGKWMETPLGKVTIGEFVPAVEKSVLNKIKIGQNLSLAYMSIISNTDVYDTALEHGATRGEAAAIAFGSMLGMYGVDRYAHLGEVFFDPDDAMQAIRQSAKHNAELVAKSAGFGTGKNETKKGLIGLIKKGIDSGKKSADEFTTGLKEHTLGFFGKAMGEGIEEVSEELVADTSKAIMELAGKLGYASQTDYGAWENWEDRYSMSFIGGALGGGVFYGVDAVQKARNNNSKQAQTDLIYLIRQGKKDEILSELSSLKKKGQLGNTKLSYDKGTDSDNNIIFITADENHKSQNDYIYDTLVRNVNELDAILNENNLKLNDDELFDKMVQGEYRAMALTDFLKGDDINGIKELSYVTRFQDDFQKLSSDIVEIDKRISELTGTTPDPKKRSKDGKFEEELKKLKAQKEELLKRKEYLFGEGSLGYVEKMLFAMDPNLSGSLAAMNYNQFVRNLTGKTIQELTPAEAADYEAKYNEYKSTIKNSLDDAFKLFKNMQELINPEILKLDSKGLADSIKKMNDIADAMGKFTTISFDDKLDTESDDDYKFRKTKKPSETEEDFNKRVKERENKINHLNFENQYKQVLEIAKLPLDRSTFRKLQASLGVLRKNIKENIIKTLEIKGNRVLEQQLHNILLGIEVKPENFTKIYDLIFDLMKNKYSKDFAKEYNSRLDQAFWENIRDDLNAISKLTLKQKFKLGIPIDYHYDGSSRITQRDMYCFFKYFLNYKRIESLTDPAHGADEALLWLEWDYGMNFDDSNGGQSNNQAILFFSKVEDGILDIDDALGDIVMEITQEDVNNMVNYAATNATLEYTDIIENQLYPRLRDDILMKTLTDLENTKFTDNPIIPILKQIHREFRNSDSDVESTLQEIYKSYNEGENSDAFTLDENEINSLKQFQQDLELAKAFIYAASSDTSNINPVGHNKQINQFILNHKDIFKGIKELPEIDLTMAAFLIQLANSYISEINTWIARSDYNSANRKRRFVVANKALITSTLKFYNINRDAFKLKDGTDLLEGYEDLTLDDTLKSQVHVEELLHENYLKAIANGKTTTEILEELIPKITNVKKLFFLKTSKLDEHLTYDKLTDYDKFQIIVSNFALSSVDFYTNLKNFIEEHNDLAPLSIQEYAGRMIQAVNYNNDVINDALDFIAKDNNFDVLYNTTILTGVGGSGKTKASASIAIRDGEGAWLCGPTDSQIQGLLTSLPKGEGKSKIDLFKIIFGGDKEATRFLQCVASGKDFDDFFQKTGSTVKLNENLKVDEIKDPPKYIVIDEATHFTTPELLVISRFCKKNNIKLILLGDTAQNGASIKGVTGNISQRSVIGWRTPKLSISLRDSNIQKLKNLNDCVSIIDLFLDTNTNSVVQVIYDKLMKNIIPNFKLRYYNKEKFTGEFITDTISEDLIKKMNGSIGFIGSKNSAYYKQLVDAGKDPIAIDPLQVQGQEFDYVVVDIDWNLNFDDPAALFTSMQLLYTMISRSKEGTIIIDNGLSKNIKNKEETYTVSILEIKDSIEEFRENRLAEINEALADFANRQPTANPPANNGGTPPNGGTQNGTNPTAPSGTNPPANPPNNGGTNPSSGGNPPNGGPQGTPPAVPPGGTNNGTLGNLPTNTPPIVPPNGGPQGTPPAVPPGGTNNGPQNTPPNNGGNSSTAPQGTNPSTRSQTGSTNNGTPTNGTLPPSGSANPQGNPPNNGGPSNNGGTSPTGTKSSTKKKKGEIKGTEITTSDTDDEETAVISYEKERKKEIENSKNDEDKLYLNGQTPFRAYGNVSIAGIDTSNETWINPNDSRQDLGIFIRKGTEVKDGKDKHDVVNDLMKLKCLLIYGSRYYDRLGKEPITDIFSEDSFKKVEYYIKVEDVDDTKNRLVGLTELTGLKNENRGINGKVISLVAKIVGRDKNVYTVTLGTLANPETWEKNVPKIKKKLNYRISHADPDSEHLKEYLKNLNSYVSTYKSKITELSKKDLEFRINKPNVSGLTTLIELNGVTRLERLDSSKSTYEMLAGYSVMSPVYAMVDDIPGVSSKVKGKAVIYVTNNLLLKPSELERLYLELKNNPNNSVPQVRMVVLDNLGVSFKALYNSDYRHLISPSNGSVSYTMPFKLEPTAVRMYVAAWNFRANLKRFMEMYNKFKKNNNLSDLQVEDLCKLDSQMYFSARGKKRYLNEKTYRDSITDEETRKKLKTIWDFNDSLAKFVPEFRLGYESKNGAYLRKLTNLSKNGFYKDPDNVIGIYINPSLAIQYDNMLDKLFENILNKIVPTNSDATTIIDSTKQEYWFSEVLKDRTISFNIVDKDNKSSSMKLSIPGNKALSSIPIIFTKIARYSFIRGFDPERFDLDVAQGLEERYDITLGDEKLDWVSILNELEGGLVQNNFTADFVYSKPGIKPYSEGKGIYDERLDNLFNLMFHGLTSLEVENNFKGDEIRATDAKFKYGFFVDPLLQLKTSENNANAVVITSKKFFGANVVSGFPIIGISFEPYVETSKKSVKTTNKTVSKLILDTRAKIKSDLSSIGIKVSDKELNDKITMEELVNLVKNKIKSNFELYFSNSRNTPLENLYSEVELVGDTFKYTKFIETIPMDSDDSIKSYEHKNGIFKIYTNKGRTFNFQIVENQPVFNEVSQPVVTNNNSITVGEVRNNIDSIVSPLYDELEKITRENFEGILSEEDIVSAINTAKNDLLTTVNDLFNLDNKNSELSMETVRNKIESLLEKLADMFEDDNELCKSIISKLSDLKNNSCELPLF